MITQEILNQLKVASKAATKGPWSDPLIEENDGTRYGVYFKDDSGHELIVDCHKKSDAAFIALARNHIDALIERVEELEKLNTEGTKTILNGVDELQSLTVQNAKLGEDLKRAESAASEIVNRISVHEEQEHRLEFGHSFLRCPSCSRYLADLDKERGK